MIEDFNHDLKQASNGDGIYFRGNDSSGCEIKSVRLKYGSDTHTYGGHYELSFTFDKQLSFVYSIDELNISCTHGEIWSLGDIHRVIIKMVPGPCGVGPVLKAVVRFDELDII